MRPSAPAGLDYALYMAKMFNIKVVLVLADNWSSVLQYLDWSPTVVPLEVLDANIPKDEATGDVNFDLLDDRQKRLLATRHALFFSDPSIWDMYVDVSPQHFFA